MNAPEEASWTGWDEVLYGQRWIWPPPPGWAERELLQPTVVTDGGPWAEHNYPCPVCVERPAVRHLSVGAYGPCDECGSKGWRLAISSWDRLFRWATEWRSR